MQRTKIGNFSLFRSLYKLALLLQSSRRARECAYAEEHPVPLPVSLRDNEASLHRSAQSGRRTEEPRALSLWPLARAAVPFRASERPVGAINCSAVLPINFIRLPGFAELQFCFLRCLLKWSLRFADEFVSLRPFD